MSSNRIKIFQKASNYFKKSLAFSKNKASQQLPHCHSGQSAPDGVFIIESVTIFLATEL
jgi:hypothetical protein